MVRGDKEDPPRWAAAGRGNQDRHEYLATTVLPVRVMNLDTVFWQTSGTALLRLGALYLVKRMSSFILPISTLYLVKLSSHISCL